MDSPTHRARKGEVYDLERSARTLRWMLRTHELLSKRERAFIERAVLEIERRAKKQEEDRKRREAPIEYGHHYGETPEQAQERRLRSLRNLGKI